MVSSVGMDKEGLEHVVSFANSMKNNQHGRPAGGIAG